MARATRPAAVQHSYPSKNFVPPRQPGAESVFSKHTYADKAAPVMEIGRAPSRVEPAGSGPWHHGTEKRLRWS